MICDHKSRAYEAAFYIQCKTINILAEITWLKPAQLWNNVFVILKKKQYTIANKSENHQQFGLAYKDWCREKLTKHSFTTLLWLVSVFFCISLYNFSSSEALHNCILRPDLDGKSVVYYYNYLQGMIS